MKKPNLYYLSMKVLMALMLFFAVSGVRAQVASDEVLLANDVIVNNYQIEFDVYVKSTNNTGFPTGFPYGNGQYRVNFNNGIRNGSNTQIFFEIIAATSELTNPDQVNQVVTQPSLTQAFCRVPARLPVPYAVASIISNVGNGTKIFRMRLTSRDNTTQAPVSFVANSLANLAISASSPGTTAVSFVVPAGTVTTCTPQILSNLLTNAPLNAAVTPPAAFAVTGGGSYCQGAGGLPVGLSGSQLGVTYTLSPGAVVLPGTGAALSFGNQLAGTYTVSGTNAGGTTAMTGSAVITETPVSTVEVTVSACDTYTWAVNGQTYTASGDYTYVNACVTNILHLTITPSSTVHATVSACDTYTWAVNGQTYTASGDYTFVVGCVTNMLHLTITPSSTVEQTASACDTYIWAVNGQTYTASGDYTFVVGCVTNILHLTITPSSTVEFTASACDTYIWAVNGQTYTASGDYTSVVGCVTSILHLTITPSSTVEFTASACDSYTWAVNGQTYTASGDYTSVVGCVTNILHLTIIPSGTTEYTASACDSYTWAINGVTYTASGDYTYVSGCGTSILHLTITPSSTVEFTASACDSYTWVLNGMTYTASGDYTYVVGCVTNILHLTITPTVAPTFTQLGPYVQGSVPGTLPGTSNNGISGTWNPATISTASVGFTTYLFTPATGQCALSNEMVIEVTPMSIPVASTWNGTVSSDWFNAANWTNAPAVVGYPGAATLVTIPGGVLPNYLTLAAPAACATFTIQNGGSFIGSEFLTVSGQSMVSRVIPNNKYHYMSSPVQTTTWGQVFSGNMLNIWVKEWNPVTNAWVYKTTGSSLVPGIGSAVYTTSFPRTAEFKGTLNKVDVTTNNLSGANGGFNMLGNPFQSSIDWDNVIKGAGVSPVVKVWNGTTYLDYSSSLGSGSFDGLIPAENGFFVSTTVNNDFVTVPLAARTHGNPATFYKNAVADLLRINVNGNDLTDATFIHFNNEATSGYDSQFDGVKLWGESYCPQVYSLTPTSRLSINELPMAGNEVVDLGFKCDANGEYSFTASGIESFDATTPVILEDLMLSKTQDLRQNPVYSFSYVSGDNESRFRLHFKSSTGIGDLSNGGIGIYSLVKSVVITNATQLAGEVWIYDVAGRELIHSSMSSQGKTTIPVNAAIGIYMVKVVTAKGSVNQKVFIR